MLQILLPSGLTFSTAAARLSNAAARTMEVTHLNMVWVVTGMVAASVLAGLLCHLRVARPLPNITRLAILVSLLLQAVGLAYPPFLLLSACSWACVVLLLLLDELLLVRAQQRQRRTQQL
jgi:hypothetical protein